MTRYALSFLILLSSFSSFAQTNRSAPRPSQPAAPRTSSAPAAWQRGTTRPSLGAGIPLKRAVFVPNISFEMNFLSKQDVDCPSFFTAVDEAAEGINSQEVTYRGEAPMRWFCSAVHIAFQGTKRTIWKGQLRSEFSNCKATATMSAWGARTLNPQGGHLSLTINNGTATFTADLSRYKNAAFEQVGFSETGRPTWTWALKTP